MDEHVNRYYVNSTQTIATINDVQMFFYYKDNSRLIDTTQLMRDDTVQLTECPIITNYDGELQAIIAMSPQHAKSLLSALEMQITNYENKFGTILLKTKDE